MRALRGLFLAFGLFAAAFALHVIAGATDQGWLFTIAVMFIYFFVTGFPFVATVLAGTPLTETDRRILLGAGSLLGIVFTSGAYWAAAGREMEWWVIPAAVPSVLVVSTALFLLARFVPPLALRTGMTAGSTGH